MARNRNPLAELMASMNDGDDDAPKPMSKSEMRKTVYSLRGCFERLNEPHEFKPGQIVRWKEGLKNKRINGPFIVIEMFAPTFDSDNDSGSPYFREPLDMIAGSINDEAEFICFHYDSRRFEPHPDYQGTDDDLIAAE